MCRTVDRFVQTVLCSFSANSLVLVLFHPGLASRLGLCLPQLLACGNTEAPLLNGGLVLYSKGSYLGRVLRTFKIYSGIRPSAFSAHSANLPSSLALSRS